MIDTGYHCALRQTAMSLPWFKNLVGFQLTDEEMRDIPYPYVEMYTHVIIKCAESFGLLGTLVVGPLVALGRSKTRTIAGIKSSACRCGKWGVMLSFIAGPVMTRSVLNVKQATPESVYDRCYRIRNNRGQVRVDRGSAVGALSGSALMLPMGGSPVMGALVGMSVGIISMAVYNNAVLPSKKQ